jgi:hypothetical protein
MPRKKTARPEEVEEELLIEDVEELDEDEQDEEEEDRRNGGLDIFDADGNLLEEGEPTYIEDEEEEEE